MTNPPAPEPTKTAPTKTAPTQPVPMPPPPPSPWGMPPPPRPLFSGPFWRRPVGAARLRLGAGVVGVALLAAATLPAPTGLQWPVLAGAVATVVLRTAPRPVSRGDRALLALVLALVAVGAVRVSASMFALCVFAALGLGAILACGARSWPGVLLTGMVAPLNGLRCLPWTVRGLRRARVPSGAMSLVRGLVVAGVLGWVCLELLASADGAFAGLLEAFEVDAPPETLVVRTVIACVTAALALMLAFNVAAPPRWRVLRVRRRPRPFVEWLVPIVAVDAILVVFLAVQAAVLFDAYPDELVTGGATPAERARQGFGQLVVLTLVVAALLAWAGRICDDASARDRSLLAGGGGALLVLVLVVVASALRRLWLYEQTFGWTVLRLEVGVFEAWLAVVILGTAAAWAMGRTALLPRLVPAFAGIGLLALALAGPDALVASWNVDRFQEVHKIDAFYLRGLSDDAVPALSRLPEPLRSCVLGEREASAPWYAVNLSRLRARHVLDSLEPPPSVDREGTTCAW